MNLRYRLRAFRQLLFGCPVCTHRTYHAVYCRYGKVWPR